MAGYQKHRHIARSLVQLEAPNHLPAVDAGDRDVHDDHPRKSAVDDPQRLPAVAGFVHTPAGVLEQCPIGKPSLRIVLNEQDQPPHFTAAHDASSLKGL